MTDRELMQQAVEVLQHCLHYAQTHLQDFDAAYNRHPSAENERCVITDDIEDTFAAIAALRERLAQPEQEPVAWKDRTYGNLHHQNYGNSIPLYTAPQPAQQPLTDRITTLEAALRQALEALEFEASGWEDPPPITREAITAAKQVLGDKA